MLGVPQKITAGNTRISFRGAGPARFKVQHARDCDGQPDALSWCDVSQASNGARDGPTKQTHGHGAVHSGMLVDVVDGDTDVIYRRHNAGWLRVVAASDEEPDEVKKCSGYAIRLEPMP